MVHFLDFSSLGNSARGVIPTFWGSEWFGISHRTQGCPFLSDQKACVFLHDANFKHFPFCLDPKIKLFLFEKVNCTGAGSGQAGSGQAGACWIANLNEADVDFTVTWTETQKTKKWVHELFSSFPSCMWK